MDQTHRVIRRRIAGAILFFLAASLLTAYFLTSRGNPPSAPQPAGSPSAQTGAPAGENLFQSLFHFHSPVPSNTAIAATGTQGITGSIPAFKSEDTFTPTGAADRNPAGLDDGGMYYFPTDAASGGTVTATLYVIFYTHAPTWTTAPSATPTRTFTPKPTSTPRNSATATRTHTAGATSTATATSTPTPTPTATVTATASATLQETSLPSQMPSPTPTFSVTGAYAFLSRNADGSTGQVSLVELPEIALTVIADLPGGDLCGWAPDGSSLLVQVPRQNSTLTDLKLLALDGIFTPLTASLPGSSQCGDWLPDGSGIIFPYTDETGAPGLSRWDAVSGETQRMYADGYNLERPDVSPDGGWVVFTSISGTQADLFIMNLADRSASRLIDTPENEDSPRFTADSRSVIFSRSAGQNWDICSFNLDTSEASCLTNNPANERWPDGSPDGRSLLFSSDAGGVYHIYLLPVGGVVPTLLLLGETDQTRPLWRP